MNIDDSFQNPFKPGAGHSPPYLAGRSKELDEFKKLLKQREILENLVLTGLRGTGKTVLLEKFRPMALSEGWMWVGTDMSESASTTEENLAIRMITDLSVATSNIVIDQRTSPKIGFTGGEETVITSLNYMTLMNVYNNTPGLISDKLKATLEIASRYIQGAQIPGVVFAYDESQNLSDHPKKAQFPLSMLLDIFQSLQRSGICFMMVLTGLPTLFPKLVDARTYAERMFHVMMLEQLGESDSRDAIIKPIETSECPVKFDDMSVNTIVGISGGYPYFIQFICREVYDLFIQKMARGEKASVPVEEIVRKLDTDFFAGRWNRATDRQRELLHVISQLNNCDHEFSVQEIVDMSRSLLDKPFGASNVNQMLGSLTSHGLIYKNRHGRYSFAVPLLGKYIRRMLG
ncbi:MAG: hypothetical protein ACH255_08975 [Candidatus Thiodiazotropha sp.]